MDGIQARFIAAPFSPRRKMRAKAKRLHPFAKTKTKEHEVRCFRKEMTLNQGVSRTNMYLTDFVQSLSLTFETESRHAHLWRRFCLSRTHCFQCRDAPDRGRSKPRRL
jgi:hypothetical protein